MFVSVLVFAISIMHTCASTKPEQIHIAMAGKDGMRISWYTEETTKSSVVKYGIASVDENSIEGIAETYLDDWGSHHTVLLPSLKRNTRYIYSVGGSSTDGTDMIMSDVFSFATVPEDSDTSNDIRLSVFGDMGYLDSTARPMGILGSKTMAGNWSATYSRELMESWKDNNEIDMVWHVGDVGYADDAVFHTLKTAVQFEYEEAYNGYMNWIQNITAVMPYHVVPGACSTASILSVVLIIFCFTSS